MIATTAVSANDFATTTVEKRSRTSLPILSQSEAKCFRSCQRKHYIAYRLLVRPLKTANALAFGTLMHRALEAWWIAARDNTGRLEAALAALDEATADPLERAKAEELMIGYHARWSEEIYEVLDVEAEFETAIVNPSTGAESRTYALGGKIDAIVRLADGRIFIVEHKTSSEDIEPGSDYWQRLRLDAQVYAYIVGARALGHDVAGCLYDVIGKPRLQPLQATPEESRKYTKSGALYAKQRDRDETVEEYRERLRAQIIESPDRYYVRGTVVRLAEDEREAALDLWQIAREIREADLGLRHPRNPDACKSWGRTCEYFAVCARETDLDDPTRYRRAAAAHEELSAPPAVAA